ncbi:MAG: EAL domain-containing protein [Leptolyngbyaceae cyanobacterium SM1_1_3]|nr:EAL domain-containing protein [Leptolyngbyaceae cyanobacterium SM1_1_3]NJN03222.1 EAL domain-containing protein [Leptolyngbyaceae cyanobacterium RM1_1_2]NJO11889.1 EAL domain-containing protein [Leptolyngbyaceae cyanobacterium SL_1_1]
MDAKTIPSDDENLNLFDRSSDEIHSQITQELRTSLTPIQAALTLLEKGIVTAESESGKHLLKLALGNTNRLLRMIQIIESEHIFNYTTLLADSNNNIEIEKDLNLALARQELKLFYQPIICLKSGKIKSFEALVRWQHPTKGMLSPDKFISVAENSGLIHDLGIYVFEQACQQLQNWQQQFKTEPSLQLSINLSGLQLIHPDLSHIFGKIFTKSGLSPGSLNLEITESALTQEDWLTLSNIKALKQLGIEFSVDDFGTGYSSLSRLEDFPINTLKIDRSFVQLKRWQLVKAILLIASSLNLNVIIEGIETFEELESLRAIGGRVFQGYFFSEPIDGLTATHLIQSSLL